MKLVLLLLSVALSASYVYAQEEKPLLTDGSIAYQDLFNTSMKDTVACYRIPVLVTAPNGDLVVAIDERVPSCSDLKDNRDINIVARRSSDHGKTWSAIEMVVDFPRGQSASDPSMIVDKTTNEIFLFYNYMDLDKENAKMKEGRKNMSVRISYDEGKTWTAGKTIYAGGAAYSSLTILENGDIGLFFEKDDYRENVFVSFSLDWLTSGVDSYEKPGNKINKQN